MEEIGCIPQIFRDVNLQEEFDNEGFVVIELLSVDQIDQIRAIFTEYFPTVPNDIFGSSSFLSDKEIKIEISDRVDRIIRPRLEEVFVNFTSFGSAFLYKSPGIGSELAMHQDWTVVNEQEAVVINIWFPLEDTNEENGTLSVLPRSHFRNLVSYRAPTLPFFYDGNERLIHKHLKVLNVSKGGAVILNQSLVHYSSPNTTNKIRVAITSGVKTRGAQMIFLYKDRSNPESPVLEFEIEDDFLQSFTDFFTDIQKQPDLPVKKVRDHSIQKVFSKRELINFLEKIGSID